MLYIFPPGSVPQYGIGVIPKDEVQKFMLLDELLVLLLILTR